MGQDSVNKAVRTVEKVRRERMLIFTISVESTDRYSCTAAEMTYNEMEVHCRQICDGVRQVFVPG